MMQFLHLGRHKVTYTSNDSGLVLQLSNLIDLFLGGRKTCRAIKFTVIHADKLKLRGVGKARFMTIQTFEGPFLSAVTPHSYEYIHATAFLKVIRSIKEGDLLPEFIPDPVGAGVYPCAPKKVRPHAATFNERRKLTHPEHKAPRKRKKCNEPECNKHADKTGRCSRHGGGARCLEPGCIKCARGTTGLCTSHGGGARCLEPGCIKAAQGKTGMCTLHGGGGARCIKPDCPKGAAGPTDRCIVHGGGYRCISCTLYSVSKKGGTCSGCSPANKEKAIRKEIKVLTHLRERLPVTITHNASVGFVCGNFRPDMIIEKIDLEPPFAHRSIVIEVDEQQHKEYPKDCERIRQRNIAHATGHQTVFIRFNPDAHHDADGKAVYVSMDSRLRHLLERVQFHLAHNVFAQDGKRDEELVTEFLYYDTCNEF